MSIATISPQRLHELTQSGKEVTLIDVRTPLEFREVHVSFARNVPLDQLQPGKLRFVRNGSDRPLYVICRSGNRGKQACEKLATTGDVNVVNVEGGTLAWEQAGLPVIRGQKAISLERQVRITVGFLVLIASVLAYFVHPYWTALTAFLGAGLIFSGVTDTCGMALILARMPWNQVSEAPSNSTSGGAQPSQPLPNGSCCS